MHTVTETETTKDFERRRRTARYEYLTGLREDFIETVGRLESRPTNLDHAKRVLDEIVVQTAKLPQGLTTSPTLGVASGHEVRDVLAAIVGAIQDRLAAGNTRLQIEETQRLEQLAAVRAQLASVEAALASEFPQEED